MKNKNKLYLIIFNLVMIVFVMLFFFDSKHNYRKVEVKNNIEPIELADNFDGSKLFLIGFDDEKLYVGSCTDSFKIIPYDLENKEFQKPIYENKNIPILSYANCINGSIYIVENYMNKDTVSFALKSIDKNGNLTKYMERTADRIPYINSNENHIFINYSVSTSTENPDSIERNRVSYLEMFNVHNRKFKDIDRKSYNINGDKYTGEWIVYCGGLEDTIFYQVIIYDNELETDGKSRIMKYSIENETINDFTTLNDKVLYVTGLEHQLFLSEYSYEDSTKKTGKIYHSLKIFNKYQEIEEISPGLDVLDCKKLENDNIVLFNVFNYYVYNPKEKTYFYVNYNDDLESRYSDIKMFNNNIGYIKTTKDKSWFYRINIE